MLSSPTRKRNFSLLNLKLSHSPRWTLLSPSLISNLFPSIILKFSFFSSFFYYLCLFSVFLFLDRSNSRVDGVGWKWMAVEGEDEEENFPSSTHNWMSIRRENEWITKWLQTRDLIWMFHQFLFLPPRAREKIIQS
jgi:hypothetical protein